MVETRAPGTEQISQRVTKRRKMAFFEGCPVGWGGHRSWPGGRGGRPRALVAGEGWGGRRQFQRRRVGAWLAVPKRSKSREGVGANFATCVVFVGWGGYPPELAWWTGKVGLAGFLCGGGGANQGPSFQKKGWLGGARLGGGARARGGGCKGFGSGGVSGRDTGPRDGANFATCVVFLSFLTRTKEEKWRFLKDALWGGGGGTHRSWPGGRVYG